MKTIVYKNYEELATGTARYITELISRKPDALLCFPAGETSLGTFAELVRLEATGETDLSRCKIVGLDEWVDLGTMKNENCFNFLKKHLFDHIGINIKNMCFFNSEADDLLYQCHLTDEFIIGNGGIDLMLLGLSMNGHLGPNEPDTSFDKYSHVVDLDEVSKRVAQKYFTVNVILSQGITLGMKHVSLISIMMIGLQRDQ